MAQSHIALCALAARQGEEIRAARCSGFFPLTPALSLGERVNPFLCGEQATPAGFTLRDARCSLSLRERVRVRGNGANYPLAYQLDSWIKSFCENGPAFFSCLGFIRCLDSALIAGGRIAGACDRGGHYPANWLPQVRLLLPPA